MIVRMHPPHTVQRLFSVIYAMSHLLARSNLFTPDTGLMWDQIFRNVHAWLWSLLRTGVPAADTHKRFCETRRLSQSISSHMECAPTVSPLPPFLVL